MGSSVTIRVDKQQETSMQFQPSTIWIGVPKANDYGTDPFVSKKVVHHSSVLRSLSSA